MAAVEIFLWYSFYCIIIFDKIEGNKLLRKTVQSSMTEYVEEYVKSKKW